MHSDRSKARFAPAVVLAAALGLLLWRCRYTFCWSDESFYLALAHRFWLGELPFVHEWNTAQLYTPLVLPFYSLWQALTGGEGVYLAARAAAVLLQFALAAGVYRALAPKGRVEALAAALLVLLYAKANIGGLSYYTLCYVLFGAGLVLLYALPDTRRPRLALCLAAGGLMALAVVCMPYLAALWVAPVLALVLPRLRSVRGESLCFLGGTALAAAGYLAWLLSRISLSEMLEWMPFLLMDPDGNPTSIPVLLAKFCLQPFYQFRWGAVLWAGALALTLAWPLYSRRKGHSGVLPSRLRLGLLAAALAGCAVNLLCSGDMLGKAHLALCILAAQCWLLTPAALRPVREAVCFYLPGLAFALVWQLGSNTGFSGMTMGFALACAGAAPMVGACLRSLREDCGPLFVHRRALLALALCAPVLLSLWQRVALEYRDAPLNECTQLIAAGPAAGLYTAPEHAVQYEAVRAAVADADREGTIFITALAPWAYLCTDRETGANTSWRTYLDSELLEIYHEQHPDRFPTTVLVLKSEFGSYVSTIQPEVNEQGNLNEGREDGYLIRAMAERGYTVTETPAGLVYQAP